MSLDGEARARGAQAGEKLASPIVRSVVNCDQLCNNRLRENCMNDFLDRCLFVENGHHDRKARHFAVCYRSLRPIERFRHLRSRNSIQLVELGQSRANDLVHIVIAISGEAADKGDIFF